MRRLVGALAALLAVTAMGVAIHRGGAGDEPRALARELRPRLSATSLPPATLPPTTLAPTTVPPTTAPPPPPPPTTAPPPRALDSVRPASSIDAYRGLGTWVDVYDWSRTYGRAAPLVGPDDVDRMAAAGVQTLYIQTTRWDAPSDVLDPDLLVPIITRAKARGLRVVAWYLPTLTDPAADLRRLVAAAGLKGVDSVAMDIEARNVSDVAERNRRLLILASALRHTLPGRPLGAIVLPPVVLDVVNTHYWPAFPWAQLVPDFDVWLPMAYWTQRSQASGYRSSYRYTDENITRLRQHLGVPAAPVHLIGGIADQTSPADVDGMRRVVVAHGVLGASLYDWRTTGGGLWPYLQPLRWQA